MGGKGDNNKGNAEKGTPRQYKGSYKKRGGKVMKLCWGSGECDYTPALIIASLPAQILA